MGEIDCRFVAAELMEAMSYAAAVHGEQARKSGDTPYISHLMLVASIAMEYGADLDQVRAALLHDAIEDGVGSAEEKRSRLENTFGTEVYTIVDLCTDSDSDQRPKPEWKPRKMAYLERLANADAGAKLVAASDKLANAMTTLFDLRRWGPAVWHRFTTGREGTLWYYGECIKSFRRGQTSPQLLALLAELESRVVELASYAEKSMEQEGHE